MVPTTPEAAGRIIAAEGIGRRASALRHALIRRSAGFWGDHPRRPSTVVLLRDGDAGRLDAFGAGVPGPAADWLSGLRSPLALMAPPSWAESIRGAFGPAEPGSVETRFRPEGTPPPAGRRIPVRRLGIGDAPAFSGSAPAWAALGWTSARELIAEGVAFGLDLRGSPGFAALSWVLEAAGGVDVLAVWVAPRFRRLGLGRATAWALVEHVVSGRRACPLWALAPENAASRALGRVLGFTLRTREPLWRRPPGQDTLPRGAGPADNATRLRGTDAGAGPGDRS